MNRCYANGSEINIESYVQGSQYDYVQIYRADGDPSQGSTFVLLDQMLISTNYWYSDSYGGKYWYTSGDNDKITCYSHSCSVDEDVVYNVVKTIIEHQDELPDIHPQAKMFNKENAVDGALIDIHPGAAKYYKEIGVMN